MLALTTAGRGIATGIALAAAVAVSFVAGRVVDARTDDRFTRYHTRRLVHYALALVLLIALAVIWRAFAGRVGVVLGLAAAGIAFAMQEVIGALAGWFNIMSGRIYRVGDRIQIGGVQGDVLDITLLRTKILEIGNSTANPPDGSSWVRGRQPSGRIVTLSNKMTFTDPVFNYSGASFDYIWEEMTVPIPHDADWRRAEEIVLAAARDASDSEGARRAIEKLEHDYPMEPAEVEPAAFIAITDNWIELTARFVVPVRQARRIKNDLSRRIFDELAAAGIRIASTTMIVTVNREE